MHAHVPLLTMLEATQGCPIGLTRFLKYKVLFTSLMKIKYSFYQVDPLDMPRYPGIPGYPGVPNWANYVVSSLIYKASSSIYIPHENEVFFDQVDPLGIPSRCLGMSSRYPGMSRYRGVPRYLCWLTMLFLV